MPSAKCAARVMARGKRAPMRIGGPPGCTRPRLDRIASRRSRGPRPTAAHRADLALERGEAALPASRRPRRSRPRARRRRPRARRARSTARRASRSAWPRARRGASAGPARCRRAARATVHAAAADSVTVISGFGKLMRSPTARLENGPSSIPRHQACRSSRSSPGAITGRFSPIFNSHLRSRDQLGRFSDARNQLAMAPRGHRRIGSQRRSARWR